MSQFRSLADSMLKWVQSCLPPCPQTINVYGPRVRVWVHGSWNSSLFGLALWRCSRAQQGLGPSWGTGSQGKEVQAQHILLTPSAPAVCLLWSRRLVSLVRLWLGWQGVILRWCMQSVAMLLQWRCKSLLTLQFRWSAALKHESYHWELLSGALGLVLYSGEDQRIST